MLLRHLLGQRYLELNDIKLAHDIGIKLSYGADLVSALKCVAETINNKRLKMALLSASERLKNGESCTDVFIDKNIRLRAKDRFILASNIDDKRKGDILLSLTKPSLEFQDKWIALKIASMFFCILIPSSISFIVFVMPSFMEIRHGFADNVENPPVLNALYSIFANQTNYILFILGFLLVMLFGICIMFSYSKTDQYKEEAELINIIAHSSKDEQWSNLNLVANKICFPTCYVTLKKLTEALCNKEISEISIKNSGISSLTAWFIILSLHNDDRTFLEEGASLLIDRAITENNKFVKNMEIIIVVIESVWVYLMSFILFGTLNLFTKAILI